MKIYWLPELFRCFLRYYCSFSNACMLKVNVVVWFLFVSQQRNFLYRCCIIRSAVLPVGFEKNLEVGSTWRRNSPKKNKIVSWGLMYFKLYSSSIIRFGNAAFYSIPTLFFDLCLKYTGKSYTKTECSLTSHVRIKCDTKCAVTEERYLSGGAEWVNTSQVHFFHVGMGREGGKAIFTVGGLFQIFHFILGEVSVLHFLMAKNQFKKGF